MHKDKCVADCKFDKNGYLKEIIKIHDEKLLPPGICLNDEETKPIFELQRWLLLRNISTSRHDIATYREFYGSKAFSTDTSISLFDCYWFADNKKFAKAEYIDWEKENAFDNWNHKQDALYMMMAHPDELYRIKGDSPNFTVPGKEQRIWYRSHDKLVLLHGSAQQEMDLYKRAKDNNIILNRKYVILAEQVFTVTEAQTSKDIEVVSLDSLYYSCEDKNKSKAQNLTTCCRTFGIPGWNDFLNNLFMLDETINNTSRELADISVLRDSNTLEYIGFAKL